MDLHRGLLLVLREGACVNATELIEVTQQFLAEVGGVCSSVSHEDRLMSAVC
jgi:hypothetical protein